VPQREGASWQLDLVRVDHPLNNPTYTFSTLSPGYVSDGFILPNAPQQDYPSALIRTGDQRRLSAVWSHGQLYVANTVNPPDGPDQGRATVHWFRIDTTDLSNVRLADQGNIDGASISVPNLYTYYPSVTVDDAGNMAVGFSGSGTGSRVGAFYTTRLAGDLPGYTEPIAFLRGGDDWWDHGDFGGVADWGRLSGAGLDPDGRTFLFFNEYAGTRDIIYWPYGRWVTHYGTTAYANHYRLVTAGGVSTITLDNSVTSVVLDRSGSSTQISVNGAYLGSTTAATINVQAGWARTTALTVSNAASGAYQLTSSQLVSPGLTVNTSNLGDFTLVGHGDGRDTYTVADTPAGPGHGTTLNAYAAVASTVNVQAISGALTINCSGGFTDVAFGNANSVAGVTGVVTITAANYYQVEVNDSADATNHPNVLLTNDGSTGSLTGLAPAAINFRNLFFSNLLTITGGTGNNTYSVAGVPARTTRLNTGNGADTVNVQTIMFGGPLTINVQGGGGNDVVNLGNANSLAGLLGAVTINGPVPTRVNVNDGADNANHSNVVLSATGLTGLAPAAINFGTASVRTLTVTGGNGANTYTIAGTPGNGLHTLNTGNGTDTVNVQAISAWLTVNAGGTGADVVNVGNANSLAGIQYALTLNHDPSWSHVNINDGADTANHPNVVLSDSSLTGLAPATITFQANSLNGLTVTGGNGTNTYTVANTAYSDVGNPTTLNTGNGADTVNVQATAANAPLAINGGNSQQVVNLGNAGSLAGILGAVSLNNVPNYFIVNVNDGSDNGNHSAVVIGATGVTGLAPASINFSTTPICVNQLNVTVGNGSNAFTITGSQPGSGTTLTTGTGTNTVTVTGTNGPTTLTGSPAGVNTLVGPTAATTWSVTGANTGNFSSAVAATSFTGYGSLTGGSGSNTFVFSDGASLDGNLAGGGGATLDYSLYTTSVVVDLQPAVASATGVGGSISGITSVIGASGAPGTAGLYNLLIGSDGGGDTLQGGTGRRNILVAGGSASTLIGGDGEDLLIGGTTAYDLEPGLVDWLAIANYWAGTDDFGTRSANLQSGNGVPLLDATTVTGNGGGNTMRGNGGTALIYTDGQDAIDNVFAATSLVTIAP